MDVVTAAAVPRADHGPVAHLSLSLAEIAASREAVASAIEVLDVGERVVVLRDGDGRHVWLIDSGGGREGTTVLAIVDWSRSSQLVRRALDALGLDESAVEWRREDMTW